MVKTHPRTEFALCPLTLALLFARLYKSQAVQESLQLTTPVAPARKECPFST